MFIYIPQWSSENVWFRYGKSLVVLYQVLHTSVGKLKTEKKTHSLSLCTKSLQDEQYFLKIKELII